MLQAVWRLEQEEEERRKPVLNEEEKIDFFPQWKPQQGVIGEEEDEKEEEEVPIQDDMYVETEGLIREYQRNAKPTQSTIQLLEFYAGKDWRKDQMSRCIQHLV